MGLLSNFRNRSAAPEAVETEPPALDFDFDGALPLDGSDDEWLQAAERRRPSPEAQEADPFLAGVEADVPAAGQPHPAAQDLAPPPPHAPPTPVPQVAPSVGAHAPIEHAAPATMLGALAPPPPPPMMPIEGVPQFPTEAPDAQPVRPTDIEHTDIEHTDIEHTEHLHSAPTQAEFHDSHAMDEIPAHTETSDVGVQDVGVQDVGVQDVAPTDAESAPMPVDHVHARIGDATPIPAYDPTEQLPPQYEEDPPVAFAYAPEPLADATNSTPSASEPLADATNSTPPASEPLEHAPDMALPAPEPLVSAARPPSGPEPVHMEPMALSDTESALLAPVEAYEFQSAPLAVPEMDYIAEDVHHIIEETVANEAQTQNADAEPPSPEPLPDLGIVFAGLSNAGIRPTPPPSPAAAPLDISHGPIGPQAMPHLQTLGLTGGVSWHEVTVARRNLLAQNPADGSTEQQLRRTEVNLASATLRLLRVGPLLPA